MMFDRRIVAFDIETIPDPELGRRMLGVRGEDGRFVRAVRDALVDAPYSGWRDVEAALARWPVWAE